MNYKSLLLYTSVEITSVLMIETEILTISKEPQTGLTEELKKLREDKSSMLLTELTLLNSKTTGYNPYLSTSVPSFPKSTDGTKLVTSTLPTLDQVPPTFWSTK
jgi:hypothetical protein